MLKATRTFALTGALLFSGVATASAADLYVPVAPVAPVYESPWDIAFGGAVVSDYVARGISQTNGGPAVQAMVEASYRILYLGAWVSNVNFGGPGGVEVDISAGIRPEWGRASFDLGYVQYLYTIAATSGEVYAKMDLALTDRFTIGTDAYYNPFASTFYVEGNAGLQILPNWQNVTTTLSGAVGYQTAAINYLTWNAGVSFNWKAVTLDLRYHGSSLSPAGCATVAYAGTACGHRFMAGLSFATSLSALRGM